MFEWTVRADLLCGVLFWSQNAWQGGVGTPATRGPQSVSLLAGVLLEESLTQRLQNPFPHGSPQHVLQVGLLSESGTQVHTHWLTEGSF